MLVSFLCCSTTVMCQIRKKRSACASIDEIKEAMCFLLDKNMQHGKGNVLLSADYVSFRLWQWFYELTTEQACWTRRCTIKSYLDRNLAHTSSWCYLWVTLKIWNKVVCKLESILTLSKSLASLRRHESGTRLGQHVSSKRRSWSKLKFFQRRSLE